MRNLWTYVLCGLSLLTIIYLIQDHGELTHSVTYREEVGDYIYIHTYKVVRYEQEKTKTDKRTYPERIEENKYVLPRSGESGIWNWSDRKQLRLPQTME